MGSALARGKAHSPRTCGSRPQFQFEKKCERDKGHPGIMARLAHDAEALHGAQNGIDSDKNADCGG